MNKKDTRLGDTPRLSGRGSLIRPATPKPAPEAQTAQTAQELKTNPDVSVKLHKRQGTSKDVRYAKTKLEKSYAQIDPTTRNLTFRINELLAEDLDAQARMVGKTVTDVIKEGLQMWFEDNKDLMPMVTQMRKREASKK